MKRLVGLLLVGALCASLLGCSEPNEAPSTDVAPPADGPTVAEVFEGLASLTDGESVYLDGVSITQSQAYGTVVGTQEDELASSGSRRADIGVVETVGGIETTLEFPVWYNDLTTFQVNDGQPVSITSALDDNSVVWFGDPVVTVEFHMDDGVLVLDSLVVPVAR